MQTIPSFCSCPSSRYWSVISRQSDWLWFDSFATMRTASEVTGENKTDLLSRIAKKSSIVSQASQSTHFKARQTSRQYYSAAKHTCRRKHLKQQRHPAQRLQFRRESLSRYYRGSSIAVLFGKQHLYACAKRDSLDIQNWFNINSLDKHGKFDNRHAGRYWPGTANFTVLFDIVNLISGEIGD